MVAVLPNAVTFDKVAILYVYEAEVSFSTV